MHIRRLVVASFAACIGAFAAAGVGGVAGAALPDIEPHIEVSQIVDLDPSGQTLTVRGTGYPEDHGIYVAFCVVPPTGQTPTPCGGGVDLSGESGASRWISSHAPDYGEGLAIPYGPGGSFEVTLTVNAILMQGIDCRLVQCAVVTRSDHTRLSDRSLDVIVPVFFRETSQPDPGAVETQSGASDESGTPGPRGAAPVWPVWLGSGAILAGLFAITPRGRRRPTLDAPSTAEPGEQ